MLQNRHKGIDFYPPKNQKSIILLHFLDAYHRFSNSDCNKLNSMHSCSSSQIRGL